MIFRFSVLFLSFLLFKSSHCNENDAQGLYNIGAGISDITGPSVGLFLMGYVNPLVTASGIHTRLHSRAFVFESIDTSTRLVFVSCDMGMLDHGIKLGVIESLSEIYGNETYTVKNVMISTTHTHSGPAGFIQYFAYVVESGGFSPSNYKSIVDGIVESIVIATNNLKKGRVLTAKGELLSTNGNRAMGAYEQNPEEERNEYEHTVDKDLVILRLEDENGGPIGMISWFPVHPISFNGAFNPLISSDSKGYASVHFEQRIEPGSRPGRSSFVSAFCSSNLGDASPRTENITEEESKITPPWMEENLKDTFIVGSRESNKAFELFNEREKLKIITGPIQLAQQFVEMHEVTVDVLNSDTGAMETKTLCKSAMGYEFAGVPPNQSDFWENFFPPSEEIKECHLPKPVFIPAGELDKPYPWAPTIADIQLFSIGNFSIAGVPAEFTTMSGRRLRKAIGGILENSEIVIGGVCNVYLHYVATREEYEVQEYEGSSTLFGKYTLDGYLKLFKGMAEAIKEGSENELPEGPMPPFYAKNFKGTSFPPTDATHSTGQFWGAVIKEPRPRYVKGGEMKVTFAAGNPRHNPQRGGTYFTIEKLNDSNEWELFRTDADLDTRFWYRTSRREMDIFWDIPKDVPNGTFRVRHFGNYLRYDGEKPRAYSGTSRNFTI